MFCGRVFIYLFQSFPLGDKSSVNLRGEFHSENVTTFDEIAEQSAKQQQQDTMMTEDADPAAPENTDTQRASQTPKVPKVVVPGDGNKSEDVDLDALYPLFWGLQAFFSAPSKMFESERFASFKAGLEATLSAFKNINTEMENHSARASDDARKSSKRKRISDDAEVATSFNPKYLTSRDLFDLEISDTAFRRHVLVQALILLDFVLSLTPQAKTRLVNTTNKSVLYGFTLNEEDTKWAIKIRKDIEGYLQDGPGGKFYYRMVDTVLSRDKNWARWKAEGCPLIERPAISSEEYTASRENAIKIYANKRLRPSPMGSLDLKFLSDTEALANIERLKGSDRYEVPSTDSFMKGIMNDEMDLDFAMTDEDKAVAQGAIDSKSWRILRLSARNKLSAFDKLEGNNLQALFASPTAQDSEPSSGDPKDLPQSLDGVQEAPAEVRESGETKDSAEVLQSTETNESAEPQESIENKDSAPEQTEKGPDPTVQDVLQDAPPATDEDQEMQDDTKPDTTEQPPTTSVVEQNEDLAASSAPLEDPAT